MPNYYFGGVNAAGKSTFLNRLQEMPGDWEIVHGSQALMDWLGITPGDYESLRKMPRERTYHAYGELVLDRIARKREPTSLIFDSHYLNLVGGLISRTVEGDWLSKVDALVLLTAQPDTIRDRINHDTGRDRKLFPEGVTEDERRQILDDYIVQTAAEFENLARRFALPGVIIHNEDGLLDKACRQFIDFDRNLRAGEVG